MPSAFVPEETETEKLLKMEMGREIHGSQPGKFSLYGACEEEACLGTKGREGFNKELKDDITGSDLGR